MKRVTWSLHTPIEYVLIVLAQDSYCFREFSGPDFLHSSQLSRLESYTAAIFLTMAIDEDECLVSLSVLLIPGKKAVL
jgi:hypothetical protein